MLPSALVISMATCLLCLVYVAWRLIPVDVQVALLVLSCSALVAAHSATASVRRNGLLWYSPQWITDMLLKDSLLHFLSDATLLKELRKYAPLFLGLSPHELQLYLDGAPADFREKLTRPGTLHMLPISWQQWLHPPSAQHLPHQEQSDVSDISPPPTSSAPPAPKAATGGVAGLLAALFSPRAVRKVPGGAQATKPIQAAAETHQPHAELAETHQPQTDQAVGTPGAAFDQVMSRILAMRAMSGVNDALGTVDRLRPTLVATAAGGTALLLLRFALHRRSRSAFLRSTIAVATGGAAVSVTLIWALLALHTWAQRRAASARERLHVQSEGGGGGGDGGDTPPGANSARVAQTQPAAGTRQAPAAAAAPASAFASTRPAGGVRRRLRFE